MVSLKIDHQLCKGGSGGYRMSNPSFSTIQVTCLPASQPEVVDQTQVLVLRALQRDIVNNWPFLPWGPCYFFCITKVNSWFLISNYITCSPSQTLEHQQAKVISVKNGLCFWPVDMTKTTMGPGKYRGGRRGGHHVVPGSARYRP